MALDVAETETLLARLVAAHGLREGADLLDVLIKGDLRGEIALVSSFGTELAVLLHMVAQVDPSTPVLFLDTGYLFPETLDYRAELTRHLGLTDLRVLTPDPAHLREFDPAGDLMATHPNVCCFTRKVMPLRKGLKPFAAWISGRKRYQGGERSALAVFERDGRHIKVNPLANWSSEMLAAYAAKNGLAPHPLVDAGYPSVGCEPCTTRVAPGEDARAGRWRGSSKDECGIHFVEGRATRVSRA